MGDKFFYRASDGSTLATLGSVGNHPHLWTRYRIYGPGWKPRTPLLQVPALLEILAPVSGGFLGQSLVLDDEANTRLNKLVLMRPDGSLRPVPVASEPAALKEGDEVFTSMSAKLMAYRPSTGQAHQLRPAELGLPRYAWNGYFDETGEACALDSPAAGQVAYWTVDAGHHWRREKTSQLLGSRLLASDCDVRQGRLVLVGANELLGVARATTVGLSKPRSVSSYRLDKRFMVSDHQIFPVFLRDGRLAFHTLRPGLMVATNPTNSRFEFRRAPIDDRSLVQVLGREMVSQNWGRRRDLLDVSKDAGRTWRTVDLRAGNWTIGGS